jgi:NitT/TauT family transport system substrate-binding protein
MNRLPRRAVGILLAAGLLTGCAGATSAPAPSATATTVRIASLKGPTTMGLVKLMSDAEAGRGAEDYEVAMYASPDEVVPKIVQGEADVALVPANLAGVLYNRTRGDDGSQVQVAAINTLGMLDVLESGETIESMADLAGRTVYLSGKGASPEYVLEYLLRSNGLEPGTDVTLAFKSEHAEVATLLATRPDAVGVLPQPFATIVTAQHPDVRRALSLTEEWAAVSPESEMVTGVALVRTDFATAHPDAVDAFLADYAASTEFTTTHPAEAAPLIVDAGIVPSAQIAEAAIPASHITFIDGADLERILDAYLQVLYDADPASVGGQLPGDDLYYSG